MATILVVDDRAINRSLFVTLMNYEGHRVIEACDGAEGLRLAQEELPHLVITDILMPEVDGYDFVRQMRLDRRIFNTPVIFCSAHYLSNDSQVLAEACGAFAILPKPCEPEEIVRTVREALRMMPASCPDLGTEEFDSRHIKLLTNKLALKARRLNTAELEIANLIGIGHKLVLTADHATLLREEMLGYSVKEWLSSPNFWLTIMHPDDVERAASEAAAIYAGSQVGITRFRWLTKDGRTLWMESRCLVCRDGAGNPIGLRGIAFDISDRILAETEITRAHELAVESLRVKAEFLNNMNHEFRTPMNGIIGFVNLLLDTALTPDQREFLACIRESSDNLLATIKDVLDLSSIGFGRLSLNSAPFNLGWELERVGKDCSDAAHDKGLSLSWAISPDVPDALIGDFARLTQVLATLIGNAIKFTREGRISLEVEREPDSEDFPGRISLRFKVGDTGIGIPSEKRMMIFDAFSQVDGSPTRKYGGLGLGLALCQGLIEMMGGRIWVESQESFGSTFYFTIPLDVQDCLPEGSVTRRTATLSANLY